MRDIQKIFDSLHQHLTKEIAERHVISTRSATQKRLSKLTKEEAAQRIQYVWRLSRVKKELNDDAYHAYLSMMHSKSLIGCYLH